MVDTERMKRVLSRLPPMPPLPPDFGPEKPPPSLPVDAWLRQEGELEALCREIGRKSRFLSGLMDRLRTASRRRSAVLRRIGGREHFPVPPPDLGRGGEGIFRLLQKATEATGELARSYAQASREERLFVSPARSARESHRLLEREQRRIRR